MGEWPPPISELTKAFWRVESYAVKIARQDDKAKMQRLVREYKQATDRLLSVALTDREDRLDSATEANSGGPGEGE